MMQQKNDLFLEIKKVISKERKIISEMESFLRNFGETGNEISVRSQINYLKFYMNHETEKLPLLMKKVFLKKVLPKSEPAKIADKKIATPKKKKSLRERIEEKKHLRELDISDLEKSIMRRIGKRKEKKVKGKTKKPNIYAGISSRLFSDVSRALVSGKSFGGMIKDLLRTNMQLIPTVYISMILFSTLISIGVAVLIFLLVFFFNISPSPPFLTFATGLASRFLETFWILFIIPIGTFLFAYLYPTFEKKSLEAGIDQELPFATINMSAIAGSRIEPTNIFGIIIATGQYPNLKTQFTKVLNEINVYGHDLVTALRSAAFSSPSKKLSDLYNGLATNITSGGDLAEFFEKRSQTLLLDYRLQRERSTRSAETFIDIYISVVIAAPMILMLLLVMIQISGLGISLSPTMISLAMITGVAVINFAFLMFLRLRQPGQ